MITPIAGKAVALTVLNFVAMLAGRVLKHRKADSLIRFTKSTRVEPIALVDEAVSSQPYMTDIMQALSSMFIGYYLQAVSLSVNVGSVNVLRMLDSLNPSRDVETAAATLIGTKVSMNSMLSAESYGYQLPVPGETTGLAIYSPESLRVDGFGLERYGDMVAVNAGDSGGTKNFDTSLNKAINEATNLSVGKMIEVTVEDDGRKATFPILIRVISTIVQSPTLVHILGDGSRNNSIKERYHAWRSGQISFIRDLVLAQDLIDEHRKTLLKDKSGAYAEILQRRQSNGMASVLSGNPSVATASNLIVMSKTTAQQLERSISGRLDDPRTRERVFANTYVMLCVVVDTEREQVTIYSRGIALPTQLSVKDLKTANKGSGSDVGEILKAFQMGINPVL